MKSLVQAPSPEMMQSPLIFSRKNKLGPEAKKEKGKGKQLRWGSGGLDEGVHLDAKWEAEPGEVSEAVRSTWSFLS